MSFLRNNQSNNIVAEGELASILSQFDTNYVFGIMDDILEMRFSTFDLIPKANIVISYEDNFKSTLSDFPGDKDNIFTVKDRCYGTIIDRIAKAFDFEYRGDDSDDLFSVAKILYDFFISNYNRYVIDFLATVVLADKKNIYKALSMDRYKRDKDITTVNNKKIFNDPYIAILTAHMEEVMYYLLHESAFTMQDVLARTHPAYPYYINVMLVHVFPVHNFFDTYITQLVNSPLINASIITSLKLEVQRRSLPADFPVNMNF